MQAIESSNILNYIRVINCHWKKKQDRKTPKRTKKKTKKQKQPTIFDTA